MILDKVNSVLRHFQGRYWLGPTKTIMTWKIQVEVQFHCFCFIVITETACLVETSVGHLFINFMFRMFC